MDAGTHPLLRSIVAWAERRPDVRAVVLRASRSAEAGTGDAVDDFDVDLHVDDPGAFGDDDWLERIAPVLLASEDEEDGDPVRLVFFSGQRKVEFRLRRAEGDPAGRGDAEVLFAHTGEVRPITDGAEPPSTAPPRRAVLRAVVPVFTAPDVPALLAHYRALGFDARTEDDGTGVAVRDGLVLRVAPDPEGTPAARGLVHALVDDPGALAREWASVPGGRTSGPREGRPREWSHADPAGNVVLILPFPGGD